MKSVVLICVALCQLGGSWSAGIPPSERIVGGKSASISNFPYQISLRAFGMHQCGGTIIKPRYVLTAAHCTEGMNVRRTSIRAGITNLVSFGGSTVDVTKFIIHPLFNKKTMANDAAILVLARPLIYSATIQPISLAPLGVTYAAGSSAVVTGWGYIRETAYMPSNGLQYVNVPIVDSGSCRKAYGRTVITPANICAGNNKGDACQGDSGGPLALNGKLIGIVSFGNGCNRPGFPGVYTNVGHIRSWIDRNTN